LVDELKVGTSGYAYVVDRQGKLIAFSDTARVLEGENLGNLQVVGEFVKDTTDSGPGKAISYQGIKGFSVVGTYVPLGTPDWAVITEIPWQEAYADIIRVAIASAGIILALATMTGLGGILLARRLSVPLLKLTETATAIAAGDLDRRANIKSRDEVGALATAFNNMTDQLKTLIGNLEERVDERTQILERRSLELQTAAQVARDASIAQNIESLLERAAILLHDKFNYYHIGLFLLDDNEEYAVLRAAGGDAGQLMLARKHKLKVGETGIVGHVAQTGEPRIALDVGTDAVHFQNPLLPYTRSEMALPIKVENHIIGVLDVQSDKVNAFDQNSISIMQIVTDQVGVAIERTRLLEELVQNAAAVEQSSQEYTARTWRSFLQQARKTMGYRYEGVSIETMTELPVESQAALQQGEAIIIGGDGKKQSHLAVPIRLRGQTLGILSLRFQSTEIPQETLQLITEAADRLALALENARLVQDAQRLATRERQINMISAQVQQSTDLETVLQNTIRELGNTLGVPKTFIQIGIAPSNGKDK
jgi:nitrate/nitrite-specific signal transduction histidine kinase